MNTFSMQVQMDRLARLSHLERMLFGESEEPKALPLSLLEDITNGFSDEQEIGSGGFAVVYKGDLQSRTIAVKKLSKTHMHEKEFHREVECLMNVKHKNIVRFLGYCADTQGNMERYNGKFVMADVHQRLLCFEYLPKGSLDKYITDASSGLEWRKRYQIIKGICEGLYYLHRKRIVHLDLKPANILLDSNMVPKIADFGLSRCFDENQTRAITSNIIGSMGYLAAEFYSGHITLKSDIYSLGITITEILTGDKGYSDISNVLESWRNRLEKTQLGEAELEQIRVCAKIGSKCTKSNPAKRPDIEDVIHMLHETEMKMVDWVDEDHELRTQVKQTEEDTNTCADSGTSHVSGPGSTSIMDGMKSVTLDVMLPRLGSSRSKGPGSVVEHFTVDVLHAATEGFADGRRIGSGSFGSVYRGTLPDGRKVAIKRAEDQATRSLSAVAPPAHRRDRETAFHSELIALAHANHKNIVCLLGFCAESGERVLVYEFMINGTLHDQLHDRNPMAPPVLSWRGRLAIALDAARGIEYMHVYAVPSIIHRDVKPANILLDDSWIAKIADFGLSSGLEPGGDCAGSDGNNNNPPPQPLYTGGTGGYVDPEYDRLQHLTDKSDVYSFGVVLLELMFGCRVLQRYAESVTPKNVVEFAVPHILADDIAHVLDPRLPGPTPHEAEALAYVGYLAADCVGPIGCDRPSMTEVVDALERALAACSRLPGSPSCSTPPFSRFGTIRRVLSRSNSGPI